MDLVCVDGVVTARIVSVVSVGRDLETAVDNGRMVGEGEGRGGWVVRVGVWGGGGVGWGGGCGGGVLFQLTGSQIGNGSK